MNAKFLSSPVVLSIGIAAAAIMPSQGANPDAAALIEKAGIRGGLIGYVMAEQPSFKPSDLLISDSFLVAAIADSDATVKATRRAMRKAGMLGPVMVDQFDGSQLPFVNNAVNLLILEHQGEVSNQEIQRALIPGGIALRRVGEDWLEIVKPIAAATDEWTHCLYDASNNAVSRDTVVAPPRHLQWAGSPAWTRHHDHMSSFSAMVSAGGRVFYILDEGPRAEIQLPPDWQLTARDAHNGVVLWRRRIGRWHNHLWPLKSGPSQLARRLVAAGDVVYVTLGIDAPVSALDAGSGETIREFEQSRGTEEILLSDDTLFLLVNPEAPRHPWSDGDNKTFEAIRRGPSTWSWQKSPRKILAIDPDSGRQLWQAESSVVPQTLTIGKNGVYFHDGARLVALGRASGEALWQSEAVPRAAEIRSWFAPTLVAQDGVLVFAGGEKIIRHKGGIDSMTAFDAETGAKLWSAEHPPKGYDSPEDVFIIDGKVWTAPTTNKRDTGTYTARDLRTGEVVKTFPANDGVHMPHHRCHRARATERFILASRTGIEYVDLKSEHWDRHDWVRGACLYGIMPANGLTYAPQHSCACYIVAKINGLSALAPHRGGDRGGQHGEPSRLTRGPGYGDTADATGADSTGGWPTFRCDPARSGTAAENVSGSLKQTWRTELGGKLSALTISGGKVFVAQIDKHTICVLDQSSGEQLWRWTAGGRIDSPPTIRSGRAFFGSADGSVYCYDTQTGELVWRFRAAPRDQRLVSFEQIESVWPVHGSVLVIEDPKTKRAVVHCVAGRSMFLDGGLRYLRLDAVSGELLSESMLDDRRPQTGEPLDAEIQWPNLPVALPDILSCDGNRIYMRSQAFDLEGKRLGIEAPKDFRDQQGDHAHLFSPTGFLDDSWWHRTYWIYGKSPMSAAGGWYLAAYQAPAARIMAIGDSKLYGFGRRPQHFPSTTSLEYHLFSAAKQPRIVDSIAAPRTSSNKRRRKPRTRVEYDWSWQVPLIGRAMVLANKTLFVAGPPDVVDQYESINAWSDEATQTALREQADAYAGKSGALLLAASATSGDKLAAYRLDWMPVFDGMAAAHGKLYCAAADGAVICLGPDGRELAEPEAFEIDEALLDRIPSASGETRSHPDFEQLSQIKVEESSDLDWKLTATKGRVGFALQKLDQPLNGSATLKLTLKLIPLSKKAEAKRPPGNGFLVFGDSTEEAELIKCGLRSASGVAMIIQGPLMGGNSTSVRIDPKVNEVLELTVHMDLDNRTVRLEMLGQSVEAEIRNPLTEVTHIGYAVQSVSSEFGKVEIAE